jgi:hypothetical protein
VRSRGGILTFLVVAGLGVAVLLIAAANDGRSRAFSLGVSDVAGVTTLRPTATVCERPIVDPTSFGGVRAWAAPNATPTPVEMTVSDAQTRQVLARGRALVPAAGGPFDVTLTRTVAAHRQLQVCFASVGRAKVALLGSSQVNPAVHLIVAGKPVATLGLSLVMLSAHPPSLLSMVPTAFARAALFKTSWVGTWTFWVLAAALLAAFAVAAAAVHWALAEPEPPSAPEGG